MHTLQLAVVVVVVDVVVVVKVKPAQRGTVDVSIVDAIT